MEASNSGSGRRAGAESLGPNHQQYTQNRPSPTHQPSAKAPFPWNLSRFYNMSEDSPWVPQGIVASIPPDAQSGQHLSASVNFQPTAAFQNYRSRPLQSECDTTNDDSGYGGSGAPYSIDDTSVYDDEQNPEAQNAQQLFEAFHLGVPPPPPTWVSPRPTPSVATAPTSGEHKHYCAECETWLRTRSELNKHNLRHSKPFHCEAPRCNRTEGFSTKNDLDRHKRSVHSDLSVSGPRYVCRLGQCAARDNPKLWPRADNFRSHLRRIHHKEYTADDDLGEYMYRQPPLGEDLEGVGGSALSYINNNQSANIQKPIGHPFSQSFLGNQPMATDSRHGIPQLQDDLDSLDSILQSSTSTSSENGPSGSARVQEVDHDFLRPELLHGTGQGPLQSGRAFGVQITPQSTGRYPYTQQTHESMPSNCELSVCNDDDTSPLDDATESSEHGEEHGSTLEMASAPPKGLGLNQVKAGQSDVKMTDVETEKSNSAPHSSSDTISVNLLGLHKDSERVLEYLKTLPKELLKSALNGDVENSKATSSTLDSVSQKTLYPCTECTKKFGRPCELKKHLKRHEKPYGCTFPDCSKAFGSKNDWKRHESSQHWQLEKWKCEDNKANSQQPCDKVCHRRESFKHHLSKEHLMSDAKQIEEKLDKCRIGRHCDTRFWCGFCVEIVEIIDEGVNAWTKRCDHIDDHFSGRDGKPKRHIIEWRQMENSNQRREASTQSSTEESSSTSDPGMTSPLKRKLSADAEMISRKKQRQEVTAYMWTCCRCNVDINLKTSKMCIDCDHQKCLQNCVVSEVIHQPDS